LRLVLVVAVEQVARMRTVSRVRGTYAAAVSVLDELAAVQSVRKLQHHEFDWDDIEARLGLRLPDEYKAYSQAFPPGETRIGFRVFHPSESCPWWLVDEVPAMAEHYQLRVDNRRWFLARDPADAARVGPDVPLSFYPAQGGLIPWAAWESSFVVCWDPVDPDPNRWPVVVVNEWLRYGTLPGSTLESLLLLSTGSERPDFIHSSFWDEPQRFGRYRPPRSSRS
jgi:hypothetical protein